MGNLTKLRRHLGCLTDCVAYYLNLHPESVPYFIRPVKGWAERLNLYFKRKGYDSRWIRTTKVPKRGTHIVVGHSMASEKFTHAVIYKNGKMVYDPNYPSTWRNKHITHRLIIKKCVGK